MNSKWLYLAGGVLIGWWLYSRRPLTAGTIKVGDKGKVIADMQQSMNKLLGQETITEIGVYDKKTGKVVKDLFADTHALKDPATGRVSKEFISDFNTIINRV